MTFISGTFVNLNFERISEEGRGASCTEIVGHVLAIITAHLLDIITMQSAGHRLVGRSVIDEDSGTDGGGVVFQID